uniref:Uncharacterized protein n=1 Tax=Meloidogyne javanica TaxID=6303 RepID=A0A915MSJ1_MELJA
MKGEIEQVNDPKEREKMLNEYNKHMNSLRKAYEKHPNIYEKQLVENENNEETDVMYQAYQLFKKEVEERRNEVLARDQSLNEDVPSVHPNYGVDHTNLLANPLTQHPSHHNYGVGLHQPNYSHGGSFPLGHDQGAGSSFVHHHGAGFSSGPDYGLDQPYVPDYGTDPSFNQGDDDVNKRHGKNI